MIELAADAIRPHVNRLIATLREAGAITTDPVADAFATVPRHRFVPRFHTADGVVEVVQDTTPPSEVLELVYADQALLTHQPGPGGGPSSASQPAIVARMLEALQLEPGMRVLEIGAGTGYNAVLVHTITRAPVVTLDANLQVAAEAAASITRLGLQGTVTVRHADGYRGAPDLAPFDRVIATCGCPGIAPAWLDQLTPEGRAVVPLAHAGCHPVTTLRRDPAGQWAVRGVCWADFMTATGQLGLPQTSKVHPPNDGPTRYPGFTVPADWGTYTHQWFGLAALDSRITRRHADPIDPRLGLCALHDPARGTAWVQQDGTAWSSGDIDLLGELADLLGRWKTRRPRITDWQAPLRQTDQLLTPDRWNLDR